MIRRIYAILGAFLFIIASGFSSIHDLAPAPPEGPSLLHYWNFNSATDYLSPNIGNGSLSSSLSGTGEIITDTGQSFAGSNSRNGDATGTHLRVNNPIGTKIDYRLSTQGFKDVIIKYETRRSGQGAGTQRVSYTLNGTNYSDFTTVTVLDAVPVIATLDFSAIPGVANNENFGIRFEFIQGSGGTGGNNRFDNLTVEGTALEQIVLVQYWNFNAATGFLTPNKGDGSIAYELSATGQIITDSGQSFAGLNARNGDVTGTHLRVNNPVGTKIDYHLSTVGYKSVVIKYETRRSGQGAGTQVVSYTLNGTDYINFTTVTVLDAAPVIVTLDFSAITAVNENENFGIRIEFLQGGGGTGGNNRFDNFTLEGASTAGVSPVLTDPVILTAPGASELNTALTPALSWEALANATTYDIQVSTDENFGSTVVNATGISFTSYTTSQLSINTEYSWRVRGVNGSGAGPWSEVRKFTTITSFNGMSLRINEVMASNKAFNADEDGDYQDWIELYNSGDDSVNLSGFGLTDDPSSPYKWSFPAVTIRSHEFLLVWASDKNKKIPGSPLHTNYAISASGESVAITTPEGIRVDLYTTPAMTDDISYGRYPDGVGIWVLSGVPTPGASNTEGTLPLGATVTFSQEAGFYSSSLDLQLTTGESGATILYTLDGSDPDINSVIGTTYQYKLQYSYYPGDPYGDLLDNTYRTFTYSTAIHLEDRSAEPNKIAGITATRDKFNIYVPPAVEKGTVVKARVYKEGFTPGPVTAKTYFFKDRNTHDLPIFSISATEDLLFSYQNGIYVPGVDFDSWRAQNPDLISNAYSKSNYHRDVEIPASIEFFEKSATVPSISQRMTTKISGNATVQYPSKSLRVISDNTKFNYKFFNDRNYSKFDDIVLRNGGNDFPFTLLRDASVQKSIGHLNIFTQAYRPAVLFINGEYWGITTLRERLDKRYLQNNFGVDPNNIDYIETLELKEGDWTRYVELMSYLTNNNMSDDAAFAKAQQMIDVDNLIDYQASEIFVGNGDWPANNVVWWRARKTFDPNEHSFNDGRFRWAIKDMDYSWGLIDSPSRNTLNLATAVAGPEFPDFGQYEWSTLVMRSCLNNPAFKTRFINRFADLMNTTFLPSRLTGIVDQMKAELQNEITNHVVRWNQSLNWNQDIEAVKSYINQRPEYQRQHIMTKFGLAAVQELTVNVSDPSKGFIHVNSIDILPSTVGVASTPYPWTGKYFQGVPVTIKAVAQPGYTFLRWEGATLPASPEISVDLTTAMSITAVFTDAINLVSPINTIDVSLRPTFEWTPITETVNYVVQVARDAEFTKVVLLNAGIAATTFTAQSDLPPSTDLYWRVRIDIEGQQNNWSASGTFKTLYTLPAVPVGVLPAADAIHVAIRPTFAWNAAQHADAYSIQLSTSSDFTTTVEDSAIDLTLVSKNTLSYSTKYFWRIKSINNSGESDWSVVNAFTTSAAPPIVKVATTTSNKPVATISWSTLDEVIGYEIHVSATQNFAETIFVSSSNKIEQVLSDLPDGVYYVRVRALYDDSEGEWSEIEMFVISTVTGFDEKFADNFGAYPNPVTDKLRVVIPADFNVGSLTLIDAIGRSWAIPVSNNETQVIDFSGQASGLYFVRVSGINGETVTLKILKP